MVLLNIVETVAWIIAGFGLIIIILASFDAFLRLIYLFLGRPRREHERLDLVALRGRLTTRIIFGLDFLIASDVVLSVLVPDLEEILRLGGVVLIRVILTFLISKETQELEDRQGRERERSRDNGRQV